MPTILGSGVDRTKHCKIWGATQAWFIASASAIENYREELKNAHFFRTKQTRQFKYEKRQRMRGAHPSRQNENRQPYTAVVRLHMYVGMYVHTYVSMYIEVEMRTAATFYNSSLSALKRLRGN
jgi:hypothetical protein